MLLIFYCESLHKLYSFSIHGEHWSLALEVAVKKRFSSFLKCLRNVVLQSKFHQNSAIAFR